MKKPIRLLLIALAAVSCEKVISPGKLPEQDSRLVVNCLMYADSIIKVDVSLSKSILDNKPYVLPENADCELYEDDTPVEKLVHQGKGRYTAAKIPTSGHIYKVKVILQGYASCEGSTKIPTEANLTGVTRYDTLKSRLSIFEDTTGGPASKKIFVSGSLKLSFRISDNSSEKNYYSATATAFYFDSTGNSIPGMCQLNYPETNDPFAEELEQGPWLEIDDSKSAGGYVTTEIELSPDGMQLDFKPTDFIILMQVHSLTAEYFNYQKSLNQQAMVSGDIFSEPVLVYSNVSNGMGIVAAARSEEFVLVQGRFLK
jgi:hypothetical protein